MRIETHRIEKVVACHTTMRQARELVVRRSICEAFTHRIAKVGQCHTTDVKEKHTAGASSMPCALYTRSRMMQCCDLTMLLAQIFTQCASIRCAAWRKRPGENKHGLCFLGPCALLTSRRQIQRCRVIDAWGSAPSAPRCEKVQHRGP